MLLDNTALEVTAEHCFKKGGPGKQRLDNTASTALQRNVHCMADDNCIVAVDKPAVVYAAAAVQRVELYNVLGSSAVERVERQGGREGKRV